MKTFFKILKGIIVVLILLFVAIVVLQKVTNNEKTIGGIRIFTIVTESMVPEYMVGDVILVTEKDKSDIQVGEDVTYLGKVDTFAGKVVTHRVIGIENAEGGGLNFHTQGIANPEEDPIVGQDQIYGVVKSKLKIMSWLNGIINNSFGMFFLIFIPIAIIFFSEIKAFREDKKEIEEEFDDEDEENGGRSSRRRNRRSRRRR